MEADALSNDTQRQAAQATIDDRTRENCARRAVRRQGRKLDKSRRRDPRALGYGGFMIVNMASNVVEAGELNSAQALTIAEVEAWIAS